jgi:UDP-glucuronate 4-epimerase
MNILITGAAGFIGYHVTKRLVSEGHIITALDNINNYYDIGLKFGRIASLGIDNNSGKSSIYPNLAFINEDICADENIKKLFEQNRFDVVLHFAAQAGVRYSLTNPNVYIASNVQGFLNILEAVRLYPVKHLVYASSSSVYGTNVTQPFKETDNCDNPASLYAVTKRTDELMADTYFKLYGIPVTGLRFFTVYGPWGRPDMAPFLFTKAILCDTPLSIFNNGNMSRDFTYIDDIVEGTVRVMRLEQKESSKIYNIGNGNPVKLLDFIRILELELGKKAKLNFLPIQKGDVPVTWADCAKLESDTGYKPHTSLEQGIKYFVNWYRGFYKIEARNGTPEAGIMLKI